MAHHFAWVDKSYPISQQTVSIEGLTAKPAIKALLRVPE
jgi:hypothetical protein